MMGDVSRLPAPLEDPGYVPEHPPVDGIVPDVVERWGARSQLRWFTRFSGQIKPMPARQWDRWFCSSESHRGGCCESCAQDAEVYPGELGDRCCCRAIREA